MNYLHHAASEYFPNLTGSVVSSSLAFDATITSLFGPLICGQTLYLLPSGGNLEIDAFARLLTTLKTPVLFKVTPSFLDALALQFHGKTISNQPHVLIVGGEQLKTSTAQKWLVEILPNGKLFNEYGPTEATVGCSAFALTGKQALKLKSPSVPIGIPIDNVQLYVLDENLQMAGVLVPGELYIGGQCLARGYLNRPNLTEEKFIPNPFYNPSDKTSSSRLYRTGDLVRWLPNGQLIYLGRLDQQLKVRGFRIEPEEIEMVLSAVNGVQKAAVVSDAQNRLMGFVTGNLENIDSDRLTSELAVKLPPYMVPSLISILEDLPITPNGKVDRKALSQLRINHNEKAEAPVSETEKWLVNQCIDLLNLNNIGVNHNFFNSGGTSLLAVKLIGRITSEFDINVEYTYFFKSTNIAQLATEIEEMVMIKKAHSDTTPKKTTLII